MNENIVEIPMQQLCMFYPKGLDPQQKGLMMMLMMMTMLMMIRKRNADNVY